MQIIQKTQIEAAQLIRSDQQIPASQTVHKIQSIQSSVQQKSQTQNLQTLTNSQLYDLCKEYGKSARKWMREFGFLLPEVYRRKLYRKYRCSSIHMFAAKLAGMNYDVTNRILGLAEKLRNLPLLWQEFRGFGWTKLRVIADIVENKSEGFWLDKLRKLPTRALEEYVRQWKNVNNKNCGTDSGIGLQNNLFDLVHYKKQESENFSLNKTQSSGTLKLVNEITDRDVATDLQRSTTDLQNKDISDFQENNVRTFFKKLKFRVDPETEFEFKKFKQKLEKERKGALTMGETLKALLKKVKESEKFAKATKMPHKDEIQKSADSIKNPKNFHKTKQTRHIPSAQKRSIVNQYNGKCAFPGCNEPYFELHHPDRFSISRSHEKIYPLCRIHHQAAHAGLIKNEDKPVEQWKLDCDFNNGIPGGISGRGSNYEIIIDPKDPDSIYTAYDKFRKHFADARVREYFDG